MGVLCRKASWLPSAASARRSRQQVPPCHPGHLAWPAKHSPGTSQRHTGHLAWPVKASGLEMERGTPGVLSTAWHWLKVPWVSSPSHSHLMLKKETKSVLLVCPSLRYSCFPRCLDCVFCSGCSNQLQPHPDHFKSLTRHFLFLVTLLFQKESFQDLAI